MLWFSSLKSRRNDLCLDLWIYDANPKQTQVHNMSLTFTQSMGEAMQVTFASNFVSTHLHLVTENSPMWMFVALSPLVATHP